MTASRALSHPADPLVARLASDGMRRAEAVVDFQVELEALERQAVAARQALGQEIERALADDRVRFERYRSVEFAIRYGSRDRQLTAFHDLITHVEHAGRLEAERRIAAAPAVLALAGRLRSLRQTFRSDFVPAITGRPQ